MAKEMPIAHSCRLNTRRFATRYISSGRLPVASKRCSSQVTPDPLSGNNEILLSLTWYETRTEPPALRNRHLAQHLCANHWQQYRLVSFLLICKKGICWHSVSSYVGVVFEGAGIVDVHTQMVVNIGINVFCFLCAIGGSFAIERLGRKAMLCEFYCTSLHFNKPSPRTPSSQNGMEYSRRILPHGPPPRSNLHPHRPLRQHHQHLRLRRQPRHDLPLLRRLRLRVQPAHLRLPGRC